MFRIDKNGRLLQDGRLVQRVISPERHTNGPFAKTPAVTVMHFTYGASAASSAAWFKNPKNSNRSSAHIVVGRDGHVIQCVDFMIGANHAGRSRWRGRSGLNRWAFGLELANWGYLTKRGEHWTSYTGVHIPDPVLAAHKNGNPNGIPHSIGWEPYPEIQLETAADIVRSIIEAYGAQEIIGHDDIAPNRKWDPGPAFDMAGFRDRVQDDLSSDDDIRLLSHTPGDTLNLRDGPDLRHTVLSELQHETPLQPLEREGRWIMVHVLNKNGKPTRTGWVYEGLTKPA